MPKFDPMHPRASLRRLRTAFGSFSSSLSPTPTSRSPLSAGSRPSTTSSESWGDFNFEFDFDGSAVSLANGRSARRVIRPKKSVMEMEMEEERAIFADELVRLVEPRPLVGALVGGIEEVLEGRV